MVSGLFSPFVFLSVCWPELCPVLLFIMMSYHRHVRRQLVRVCAECLKLRDSSSAEALRFSSRTVCIRSSSSFYFLLLGTCFPSAAFFGLSSASL
ncbi:hypothetical protein C8Q78DRAFT_385862 [Trametes maxima]|nr:hypothetical protein C8Q78DRAFT_385862 [Trametes maxima]